MVNQKSRCSAFDKAVNLLAFKDRTTQEITNRLKENGYSSDEIEETVEKLSYYGYLNDENYTISYIKDNTSKKGKKLIANELSHKGIQKDIISDILSNSEIDDVSTIRDIMERRYKDADLNDEKVYRRLVGFFLRRGFSYENVLKVIKDNDFSIEEDVI